MCAGGRKEDRQALNAVGHGLVFLELESNGGVHPLCAPGRSTVITGIRKDPPSTLTSDLALGEDMETGIEVFGICPYSPCSRRGNTL